MAGVASGELPDLDVTCVQRWCANKVPAHLRDVLSVECVIADGYLTIYEGYGPDSTRTPIALLRYTIETGLWTLYSSDRYQNFHRYPFLTPSPRIQDVLDHIDSSGDPIFWG
jgi:hypothetical protein